MAVAFYNEIDPYAAQWLRELIEAGHIAPGIVDERDIRDIPPAELQDFTQCHFFAGIGVWSYALRQAGWPDDRPVWTGSCPCQPFSAAGRGDGFTDERHLWPHWFHLIEVCRPAVVFGEQVASKDGLGWLDLVQADLEGADYAVGAADLCAAGVGAPHIRQRLWFVADAEASGRREERADAGGSVAGSGAQGAAAGSVPGGATGGLADSDGGDTGAERQQHGGQLGLNPKDGSDLRTPDQGARPGVAGGAAATGPTNGYWGTADWLGCRDGKWRPVMSCAFPLAYGAPARVGRLRAYGNAIVAPVASAFIKSYLEAAIFL